MSVLCQKLPLRMSTLGAKGDIRPNGSVGQVPWGHAGDLVVAGLFFEVSAAGTGHGTITRRE
jgi:hypothetical protein